MHPTTTTCILIGKFPIQQSETAWKQTSEIESLRFAFKNQKIEILMNIFGKNFHEQLKLLTLLCTTVSQIKSVLLQREL